MVKDKKISVRFCPKCEGFRIRHVQKLGNLFGIIPKQKCLDCGFEGQVFPILVTSESELKKAVEKMRKKKKAVVKKKVAKKAVKKKVKNVATKKKVARKKK